ncbi:hypothetical protein CLV58_12566 [Spirosoma oryzae]|uniref:Uncharacterized protein n=1 Tax=Spirosoma oryzae TaxID=1469603 RepID=A0A2T0S8P3_9BACT|nr:hypothetical protein [Spirosoma oryzae]PRY29804.1 hypothetical protein CLV58_12566 [Spirosoma oryzae]
MSTELIDVLLADSPRDYQRDILVMLKLAWPLLNDSMRLQVQLNLTGQRR